MRNSYLKILFLMFSLVFIPAQAALASPVAAEPTNSFTVDFTSDDGLNITTNILIPEERISGLVYRLDMGEMDVIEIEDMLESIVEECFKEQMAQWRKYEGYPHHLAELADIEEYEIDSTRSNGFYQLRYKMHLRSRHVMRTLDPTFDFRWEDDRISMFLMLHFPFPDIPLADGVSIYELAPVLAALKSTYGVFAVLGNHDLWTDAAVVRSGLEAVGIRVLVNESVSIRIGDDDLILAGLDDGWAANRISPSRWKDRRRVYR